MSTVVLRCAEAPVPITLSTLEVVPIAGRPTGAELDELLPIIDVDSLPRIIVLGDDADMAAVLTHMLRSERLDIPLGFVPPERTHGSRRLRTGTGSQAAKRAVRGEPLPTPLIRDETGAALIGRAVIAAADGTKIEGEAYVDDTLLFRGRATELHVATNVTQPGLSARVRYGRARTRTWVAGRAVQLGATGAVVTRDGVPDDRVLKRCAFYRHHVPWLLLR
ncbi:MAG: hypothetical protein HOQ24_15180 [Mycobacteriaceae bacterium]|nr:hypothetical protein [Mycobacteriaceae bacterium]